MKKTYLLNWMLVALLAFAFTACDNEPLEGDFITEEEGGDENGQFLAVVGGVPFSASTTTGQLNNGTLFLTGIKSNGDIISLVVSGAGECTYDLSLISNPSQFLASGDTTNPYASVNVAGGSGSMQIISFNTETSTVSGTFNFVGARDGVDADGNPITETIQITEGSFSGVPYELVAGENVASTCDGDGGGGDGEDPVEPDDTFFANVDGDEHIDIELETIQTMVGGVPMINITATTSTGSKIRIDIPEGLGVGTYTFPPLSDPISDGTQLYALYNDGLGGENLTAAPETGTITFTQFGTVTGKLEATFSFTGKDPLNVDPTVVEVTEGAFAVDYVDNSGGVTNSFMADVDAIAYLPTTIEVTEAPFGDNNIITVATEDTNTNQSLTIAFPKDITAGSYEMASEVVTGTEVVGYYNPDVGNTGVFTSMPGILTIISYEMANGIVEASFSFTAADPLGLDGSIYEITNGQLVVNID